VATLLVLPQRDLFTHGALALEKRGPGRYWTMSDRERDRRTGGQWLRAVTAYLDFGAGSAWRRLSDPEQRNSPERDWYLGGIRTMNGIPARVRSDLKTLHIVAKNPQRAASPRAQASPVAKLMAARSRGWIVAELLRVDPNLSDKKLLLGLSHIKLATMLTTARSRQRGVSSAARPGGAKGGRGQSPELPKRGALPQSVPTALRRSA
jgi:hypothetical protein